MAKQSAADITHIFVGGAIPLERVGFAMRDMLVNGATYSEVRPVPPDKRKAPAIKPRLLHERVKLLSPPAKNKKMTYDPRSPGNKAILGTLKRANGESLGTEDFKPALVKAGLSPQGTSGYLMRLLRCGAINRPSPGRYSLAEGGGNFIGKKEGNDG